MLENFQNIINPVELDTLIDFVESTKNSNVLVNEFVIILGDYNIGKSTLINNIFEYVGTDDCGFVNNDTKDIHINNLLSKKMVVIDNEDNELSNIMSSKIKDIISREKQFTGKILYKNSEQFVPSSNIILVTRTLEGVDNGLLSRARIINLTHKF